jgi:hypothetical protein
MVIEGIVSCSFLAKKKKRRRRDKELVERESESLCVAFFTL